MKGFSLVELMLTLLISFFLLSILFKAVFLIKKDLKLQAQFFQVELHAMQVMAFLDKEVPYAGATTCRQHVKILNHTANPAYRLLLEKRVSLKDSQLSFFRFVGLEAIQNALSNKRSFFVLKPGRFKKDAVVVVGDCETKEVVRIQSIRKVRGQALYKVTLSDALSKVYKTAARVGLLQRWRYFIKPVSYDKAISALFVEDVKGRDHELVPGVVALQFKAYQQKAITVDFTTVSLKDHLEAKWRYVIPLL